MFKDSKEAQFKQATESTVGEERSRLKASSKLEVSFRAKIHSGNQIRFYGGLLRSMDKMHYLLTSYSPVFVAFKR